MPLGFIRLVSKLTPARRRALARASLGCGAVSALLMAGAGSVHDATAYGETRTLSFHHTHSGEDLTVTFKRNGRYDDEALKKLNWFLRDWRSQDTTTMNRHLFDIVWEVYRDVDAKQPVQIISSYRSPKTNAMLRRRSSGVARFSQHMQGNAMDFFIPGVPLDQIRAAGLRLQRGGVGFYPTSGSPFVHLDTGRIRHWPRMNRDQLVRVFPNGRTVHVPSDGNPLPGYALAMADIEKRKTSSDADSIGSRGKPSLLASLMGNKSNDDEDEGPATAPAAAPAKPAPVQTASVMPAAGKPSENKSADSKLATAKSGAAKTPESKTADSKSADPAPRGKDATFQLASASSQPAAAPKQAAAATPRTPADIINARGFWGDDASAAAANDTTPTASVPSQATAFAPPTIAGRNQIVAASAPIPRLRPTALVGNAPAETRATTATAKVAAISSGQIMWLRALIVTPSVHTALNVTTFGDPDLSTLANMIRKPRNALALTFADDPQQGLITARFTGSTTPQLTTVTFTTRTAALR